MLKALKKTVIALIAILVLAGFVVLEGSPLVSVNSAEQVEDAQLVNHLLEDIKQLLEYDSAYHDLVLTTAQINSLLGFLKRAHQPLSAGFYTQDNFGRLFVTYEFTVFGITLYLNFELQLASGDRAYIERAKIGKIPCLAMRCYRLLGGVSINIPVLMLPISLITPYKVLPLATKT